MDIQNNAFLKYMLLTHGHDDHYLAAKDYLDEYTSVRFAGPEKDLKLLTTMIKYYDGGPVGLNTLAANIGEETDTIAEMYEPYLLQQGFLTRTPRGRCVTRRAYEHLGIAYMGQQQLEL